MPNPPTPAARAQAFLKQLPTVQTIVVALVLVVTVIGVLAAVNRLSAAANAKSRDIIGHSRHFESPATSPTITSDESDEIAQRLQAQLDDVRGFAHYHAQTARGFFVTQYVTITIATIAAVIAGLLLVPVSWTGWKDAKLILTLPFLLAAGTTILFTSLNQLYELDENINTNSALYFSYIALEDEILDYYPRLHAEQQAVSNPDQRKIPAPYVFLKTVQDRLKGMRTLGVVMDAASIPEIQQVFETVSNAQSGASAGD